MRARTVGLLNGDRGKLAGPFATILVALIIGGLCIAASGRDPFSTFRAVFDGSGLNWLAPGQTEQAAAASAFSLQQTLLTAAPLLVLGLAVSLPFRAGLFNIGGQGQYLAGAILACWAGSSFAHLPGWLHIVVAMAAAAFAGAAFAAIAGALRAFVGANEVITTVMLNYVVVAIGAWAFNVGGPLHDPGQPTVPVSRTVAPGARLPVFWGDPTLQGAHIGVLIAPVIAVLIAVILNRTSLGYEIRAAGASPGAARYGGINVEMTIVKTMAIAGLLAGIGGGFDVLGWEFHLASTDIQASQIGYTGIAVALLGRNSSFGVTISALLFGALLTGTSDRNLDPTVFPPSLAGSLATLIQAIVLFGVCVNVLLLLRRPLRQFRARRFGTGNPPIQEAGQS